MYISTFVIEECEHCGYSHEHSVTDDIIVKYQGDDFINFVICPNTDEEIILE